MLPMEGWLCSERCCHGRWCWAAEHYLAAASGKADKSIVLFRTPMLRENVMELHTHHALSWHPLIIES